jgi:hypothetical protein
MMWKEFYGKYSDEAMLEFLTDEKCRTKLKEKMADIERIGRNLSEVDRRVNMNATPEEFAKYLLKHNISIIEELFGEFKSMNRFRSFSDYIRKQLNEMGLKVFLPEDKRIKVCEVKSAVSKPIEIVKRNNNVEKIIIPEVRKMK